jgi:hypothetical protein
MIAKISLNIKISYILYAQNLEQSFIAIAAKIGMCSQYDILITELWLNESQSQHPIIALHCTSSNITAHVWFVKCLQRELAIHFTACILAMSSTGVNTARMTWCILPNKTCDLESLVENVGLHSAFIPKMAFKFRV